MFLFIDNPSVIVQQVPPQIQVNVQMPPGMPEWLRIVISAAVGALFALAGSLVGEYVKPWIAKRHARKSMIPQLNEELLGNVRVIENAKAVLAGSGGREDAKEMIAGLMLTMMRRDRFNYYYVEQKSLLYEYDKRLVELYSLPPMAQTFLVNSRDGEIPKILKIADELVKNFIEAHNLVYPQA